MTSVDLETAAEKASDHSGSLGDPPPIARRLRWINPPEGAQADLHESDIAGLRGPIVIVGDPGAGKSVLMETLEGQGGAVFVGATRLIRMSNPPETFGLVSRLVIDGVDEVASNAPGGGIDAVLGKLSELLYPDFILSCRAADWRGAADRIKIKDDYGRDAAMLALKPFDRDDAAWFLKTRFPTLDPDAVLDHLIRRGLHDIYGNPLTLRLLGDVAADGGALPESRGDLLAKACPRLVLEANDRHKDRPHALLDPEDVMLAAGAGAAAFLLCDKLGAFSGATADLPSAFFSLASLRALPFGSDLDDAIKTRLFKGEGESLLVPVHRVVAEYLAAKWLARCVTSGQSARRVIALLRQGGAVPTSLRAVNAWLAGFSPELGARCVADDPYGVLRYGDTEGLSLQTARALLRALASLSREDPFFRAEDWSRLSARGLARVELKDELLALLKAPGEHQLLGGLLIDALQGTELGTILKDELLAMLLDPVRAYQQRWSALDILVERGAVSDWPALLKSITDLGDETSLKIAAIASLGPAVDRVSPDQVVPILLCSIGLTLSRIGKERSSRTHHTLHPSKHLLAQPPLMLENWLDTIADYGTMPRRIDQQRMALVDFALSLLAMRLTHEPTPSPAQLARWTFWLRGQRGYDVKAPEMIRAFFADNPALRQRVQAELLLGVGAKKIMKLSFRIGDVALGLYPNDEDCAALLRAWRIREDMATPDSEVWDALLWMGRSQGGLSEGMRAAAIETAREDSGRLALIEDYSKPIEHHRDRDDSEWQAERDADAAFASHRGWIADNLEHVDAGTAVLSGAAKAYRGRLSDVNDLSSDVHEQMDGFLTPPLARRVRAGFIVALSRSDLPTALQIAEVHAVKQHYPIEDVLIAGVAEMLRSGKPLAVLPRAKLESVFMAWRRDPDSNTEDPIGIEDALVALVLDTPNAQERFYRTSIEPQLAADTQHVYDLYYLTHLIPMIDLAARLSREWLLRFPMMRSTTMSELMPSVLAGEIADVRSLVIDSRAQTCADSDALFMWLSLDFMADFADREANLRQAAADKPDFLWDLRTVISPPTGSRMASLSVDQLGYLVSAFASVWPFAVRPGQVTHGDDNPWDATDFLKECIAELAATPTAAAGAMLGSLLGGEDSGYRDELRHALAQQRRVQTDHDYNPAELGTLRAAVSGAQSLLATISTAGRSTGTAIARRVRMTAATA